MSAESSENGKKLHLPDLTIKGFRGFENLEIKRLGRVNLIVGKNSVGKSSLLEALQIFAGRCRYKELADIFHDRDELIDTIDEDGDEIVTHDWEALFYGRNLSSDTPIYIGPNNAEEQIRIDVVDQDQIDDAQLALILDNRLSGHDPELIRIRFQDVTRYIPISRVSHHIRTRLSRHESRLDFPSEIRYESLGADPLSNAQIARIWDKATLANDSDKAVEALNLIFDDTISAVYIVGGRERAYENEPRAMVKTVDHDQLIPLKSLGEGATRTFSIALALANSRDGFLLIDEVENGLHWSVQYDFWRMVIRTAHENNVQVFATTHSSDCEKWFVKALESIRSEEGLEEVDSAFIRLVSGDQGVYAIEYSEKLVKLAVEIGRELK